jgi:chitodextrinase
VNANQTLRPVTYVATGSLYGLANATQPSDALVQAIKPNTFVQMPSGGRQQPDGDILKVAPTAVRAGARLVNRFSDYYAGWPYQFSWSTWTPFVESQIAAMKASPYYSSIVAYELWNESDNTWQSANGTYEEFWTKTFRQVRALDPTKPIQGPSFSDNINDMRKFLTNAVATNTVPDILAWHELIRSSKIAGDVATVLQIEKDLGITPRPIAIEEYAAPAEVGLPGPLVGYIAKFERLGIQDAELAFWNQSGTLGDLLTSKGGSPNAAYWLYTWYAAMTGNMVVTTPPAQTGIDGFAAVPASNNQVSIIVGGCSGSCAVTVNGLNALNLGATVNVKVEQTVSLGRTVASSGPSTMSTTTYTPSSGSISVPITMATNDAYRITITGNGGNSLTVTKSGTGTGTVTSSPAGINCGSTCSTSYTSGTSVTLTATPTGSSTFAGWGGACASSGTSATCTLTMSAAQSVSASFTAGPFTSISINAGGSDSTGFVADTDFTGGSTYSNTNTIDTSLVSGVPQEVFQTERYGEFSYTVPGLTSGKTYSVTLYFEESYVTAAGQRLFDVAINGAKVLTSFDIYAEAGGVNKGVGKTFTTTADTSGQVTIQFTKGTMENPKVCGLTVALVSNPTCSASPSAPASLTATATSTSQISLAWSAVSPPSNCSVTYSVFRGSTQIATGLTSASFTDTGLAPSSTYSYTVRAVDSFGSSAASSTASATTLTPPDTQAPSVPSGLTAPNVGTTTVTLTWSASSDNVGVTGYDILRGGSVIGSSTSTSASFSNLTPGTTYAFSVRARDAAGNVSQSSGALSVTTTPATDVTPPSAPANLAWASDSGTVTITWTASTDDFGVTAYELFYGSFSLGAFSDTVLSLIGFKAGTPYSFTVKAHDAAGNVSVASNQITVLLATPNDTTPPSAPSNLTTTNISSSSVSLRWTASTDDVGVVVYQVLLNGNPASTVTSTSATVSGLSAGTSYSITAKALDAAGNISAASAALTVTTSP